MTISLAAPLLLAAASAAGEPAPPPPVQLAAVDPQDLSNLSIEQLADVHVSSVSKREEPLSSAPAAIYVITGQEIEESAATSLPEALRLAPNLWVQQVDARQYGVTARGFNGVETSDKLLVQIDGRSVYSTLQQGVFWGLHNPLLEDLDRIEVISGPGGTLYGPNAVNGVINITTRDAGETIGALVRGTLGDQERTYAARYGFRLSSDAAVRFYFNGFDREDLPQGIGPRVDDSYRGWQGGFRGDVDADRDHVTLQGDIFRNDLHELAGDADWGGNVLGRWTHQISPRSSFQFQAYYDDTEQRELLTLDKLEVIDAQAQYNTSRGAHDVVLGAGLRTTNDLFVNNLNGFALDPPSRRLWIGNAFVQDRIRLTPQLALTAGLKGEQSSFTGFELLPNVRLAWQPNARNLLWAAVSRAVRTPSRIDRELEFPNLLLAATGFESEKLVAFEAGYRGQLGNRLSLSVSLFYNVYDDIRGDELISVPGGIRIMLGNAVAGHTYGVEAWGGYQIAPWWRLNLGVSTLWKDFHVKPGHTDIGNFEALGSDPNYQVIARSEMQITPRLSFNAGLRAVGAIQTPIPIDAYVEADARLGYRISNAVEFYVAGSNLLHDTHAESNDVNRAQLAQRSLYVGTRLRF